MSKIANTENISVGDNEGLIGAENKFDVEGGVGHNAALGNTTDINVQGQNTDTGLIGATNKYKIRGGVGAGASVGNTTQVKVSGDNSGFIGSGNSVNIK